MPFLTDIYSLKCISLLQKKEINTSIKPQTKPFFYKRNVLARKYESFALKLSTDSKALPKTRLWIEWEYATN